MKYWLYTVFNTIKIDASSVTWPTYYSDCLDSTQRGVITLHLVTAGYLDPDCIG